MGKIGIIDGVVLIAFFAVMVGVGLFYRRRAGSVRGFFGGDNSQPWWLLGISFYMNSFSALAFVMYSALGYKFGFVPITISWVSVPAVLLGLWLLALRWRRSAEGSPLSFVTRRFGQRMTSGIVWMGLPMQVLDSAFKLLAIGTVVGVMAKSALPPDFPLSAVLGWSIILSGVVIICYTFMGGLKATLVCDFIQFLVILAVVVVLPVMCLKELAACGAQGTSPALIDGFRVFLDKAPDGFLAPVAGMYGWHYMLFYMLLMFLQLGTTWSLIQRYQSTRSEREAKKTGWFVAFLLFVGPPVFFFPAMAARVFLPGLNVDDPDAMNGVYALLCLKVLPTGMLGLVLAAMFSATMSTLAGTYNAVANVFTDKFRGGLRTARIATVATGLLVIVLTFAMRLFQGANDLFDITNQILSLFTPPIAIAMIAGVLSRRLTRRAGVAGLSAGIGIGVLSFVIGGWVPFFRASIPMFWITSVTTLVGLFASSLFLKDSPSEREETRAFFDRVSGTCLAVLVVFASSVAGCRSATTAGVYDVRDFGAKGDGITKDTAAIQAAIDAAEASGGGTVEIPAGRYLTGSLYLKDDIDFHVGAGAELVASTDRADYNAHDVCPQNWYSKTENTTGGHLILAIEKRNVTVRGPGRINGRSDFFLVDPKTGRNWPNRNAGIPWRPAQMLYFVECEHVRITDLQLEGAPYWSCFLHGCDHVQVRGLDIHTMREPRTLNGDGIDIDCCRYVTVSDCVIDTDDDSITLRASGKRLRKHPQECAYVTVANCVLSSVCNAIRVGVGDGRIHDAVFSDLVIRDSRTAVNLAPGYIRGHGTDITDIRFENLQVDCADFCRVHHMFVKEAEVARIRFRGASGRAKNRSHIWANAAKPFGTIEFSGVDVEGPGVEIVNAPDVVFRGSTFAPVAMTEAERKSRSDKIAAGVEVLW